MNDVIIIGGGIVGLATALQLMNRNPKLKVLVIEKEKEVARHQTGNNSGVIHSGIYYKPGSLKAVNCLRGYQLLLEFARQHDIPHQLCGKLIVATDPQELPRLSAIHERGIQNGLTQIKMLDAAQAREIEPHVSGIRAISVPYTGIIDYKIVAKKYLELILAKGGSIVYGEEVKSIRRKNLLEIVTKRQMYQAKFLINCAGLYSDTIASLTTNEKLPAKILPFRGEYYMVKKEKQHLVKSLIYPVPDPAFPFLGVHFTTMIGGGVEAGPNAVLAYAKEGYTKGDINLKELASILTYPGFLKLATKYWKTGWEELVRSYSKKKFTESLQRLVPEIQESDLEPGGAGVRASATDRNGNVVDDFLIRTDEKMIHVLNAPSPAATASLAIGEYISGLYEGQAK